MTVNELITELRKQPPETRVVVSGYEDGYDDISKIRPVFITQAPSTPKWEGRWQAKDSGERAILLFGRSRD